MNLSLALVQLDATEAVDANIEAAVAMADEAAHGTRLVVLPEYRHYRGPESGLRAFARSIPGPQTDPLPKLREGAMTGFSWAAPPRRRRTHSARTRRR